MEKKLIEWLITQEDLVDEATVTKDAIYIYSKIGLIGSQVLLKLAQKFTENFYLKTYEDVLVIIREGLS